MLVYMHVFGCWVEVGWDGFDPLRPAFGCKRRWVGSNLEQVYSSQIWVGMVRPSRADHPNPLACRLRSVTRGRREASGARSWRRRAAAVGAGGGESAAGTGRRRVPGAAAGGGAAAAGSGRSRGCGGWEQQERRRRSSARRRGPRRCAVRGAGREEDEGVC